MWIKYCYVMYNIIEVYNVMIPYEDKNYISVLLKRVIYSVHLKVVHASIPHGSASDDHEIYFKSFNTI